MQLRVRTGMTTDSLCTDNLSPREKLGRQHLCFAVDNHVQDHVIFPGTRGKCPDWLIDHLHSQKI